MKKMSFKNPYEIEITAADIPKIKADEVLVKVSYAGICGTDMEIYENKAFFDFNYPIVAGHEWSGIIERIGEEVSFFKEGDRVAGDCHIGCGKCKSCLEGDYENCFYGIIGVGCTEKYEGAFKEYIVMPERHLYKIPNGLSLIEAALTEPSVISSYSVDSVGINSGDIVLVIGTGAIGLFAMQYSRLCGAGLVILIGRNNKKLELAKKLGADIAINVKEESIFNKVSSLTNGRGVNVSIEASGNIDALHDTFTLTGKFGRISVVGCYTEKLNNVDIGNFISKDMLIKFVGGTGGGKNFNRMLWLLKNKRLNAKDLITQIVDFEEAQKIFKSKLVSSDNIKTIIKIDRELKDWID